jgi:hypothetical protein
LFVAFFFFLFVIIFTWPQAAPCLLSLSALCSLCWSYLRRSSWHYRPAGVLSDQHYEPAAVHAGVLAGAEPAASTAIAAPRQWQAVHQVFNRLACE